MPGFFRTKICIESHLEQNVAPVTTAATATKNNYKLRFYMKKIVCAYIGTTLFSKVLKTMDHALHFKTEGVQLEHPDIKW